MMRLRVRDAVLIALAAAAVGAAATLSWVMTPTGPDRVLTAARVQPAARPSTHTCAAARCKPTPSPTVTATPTATGTPSPTPTTASPSPTPATTPSPTPTPTPTPSACPGAAVNAPDGPDPWGGCWPGPRTTGVPAGTTLTVVNGDLTITQPNAVINAADIRGCVNVADATPGVVIENSRITGIGCATDVVGHFVPAHDGNPYPAGAAPLLIADTEITCGNGPGTAVGDTNITMVRVNIHGCENGGDVDGSYSVTDSYVHDLWSAAASHTDGFQLTDANGVGAHAVTIAHNWDDPLTDATSAIISHALSHDVLVKRNILGGGAYTLYCPISSSQPTYQALENRFLRDYAYGPVTECADDTFLGNVWNDTGGAVPPA